MIRFINCLLVLLLLSCQGAQKIKTRDNKNDVRLFILPFHKTYFLSVNYRKISSYNDARLMSLHNARAYSDLIRFVNQLDTCRFSSCFSTIDSRVLVTFMDKTGNLVQIGINAGGDMVAYNDKVYDQADSLIACVGKNFNIQWD